MEERKQPLGPYGGNTRNSKISGSDHLNSIDGLMAPSPGAMGIPFVQPFRDSFGYYPSGFSESSRAVLRKRITIARPGLMFYARPSTNLAEAFRSRGSREQRGSLANASLVRPLLF
jgi:hypothetical protein